MGEDEFDASPSTGLYAMRTNGVVIDGEDPDRSNYCRFINHSVRRANCQATEAWEDDSPLAAVYLETLRDIAAGEELLFDYGEEYWDAQLPRFSPQRLVVDYL